ncbi:MAG: ThiF family adenylyltransferase [Bacilli bacterium]|jgi:tRNA A37 threonylcarbamoyladenosine dehydratase
MDERLVRLEPLLTKADLEKLKNLRVAVVGLGGVGGTALEALARSGVGHFLLIDHDRVQESNLNRQMLYLTTDIGLSKTGVAQRRLQLINPEADVTISDVFLDETTIDLLDEWKPDFIIDAIDSVASKASLIVWAAAHGCPIVSSLGMGNRFDPRQVVVTTLGATSHDPLAKALRSELRKRHFEFESVSVVFSFEEPLVKSRPVASAMTVTSTAGLLLAHHLLATICKR